MEGQKSEKAGTEFCVRKDDTKISGQKGGSGDETTLIRVYAHVEVHTTQFSLHMQSGSSQRSLGDSINFFNGGKRLLHHDRDNEWKLLFFFRKESKPLFAHEKVSARDTQKNTKNFFWWWTERRGVNITILRALMGGRDEVMRANVLDLAILVRKWICTHFERELYDKNHGYVPRSAKWGNGRDFAHLLRVAGVDVMLRRRVAARQRRAQPWGLRCRLTLPELWDARALVLLLFLRAGLFGGFQPGARWVLCAVRARYAWGDHRRVCFGLVVGRDIQCPNEGGGRGCGAQAGHYLLVASWWLQPDSHGSVTDDP